MESVQMRICAALLSSLPFLIAPTVAAAKSLTVEPGSSIQAAVDAAAAGDTIKVMPGDYTEASGVAGVRITKPLRLVANGEPGAVRILWNGLDAQRDGILVEPAEETDPDIDGIEIKGFTVEGFPHNGIFLRHVNNFNIESNESINNLENGIWPTLSANGQVKKNVAYGSQDSALWVEASENVRVINNELHHSPTGLEITISKEITVENNDIHDNTVGVGLYHPAGAGLDSPWPYSELGGWHIVNNDIYDNNEENTAEGGETSALPPGIGILLLGVDRVDIRKNQIGGNNFVGVALGDWCLAVAGSGFDCSPSTPNVEDSVPDYNVVTGNKMAGNHSDTSPYTPEQSPLQPSDILVFGFEWAYNPGQFGTGVGNCFSGNKTIMTPGHPPLLTFPDPLPACD